MTHFCRGIFEHSRTVPVRTLNRFRQSPHQYGWGFRPGHSDIMPKQPQCGQWVLLLHLDFFEPAFRREVVREFLEQLDQGESFPVVPSRTFRDKSSSHFRPASQESFQNSHGFLSVRIWGVRGVRGSNLPARGSMPGSPPPPIQLHTRYIPGSFQGDFPVACRLDAPLSYPDFGGHEAYKVNFYNRLSVFPLFASCFGMLDLSVSTDRRGSGAVRTPSDDPPPSSRSDPWHGCDPALNPPGVGISYGERFMTWFFGKGHAILHG